MNDYASVADLYDLYVQATFDLAFFEEEVGRAGGPVLELMAGTGRVTRAIARLAPSLTCVDRSVAMLRHLRRAVAGAARIPRIVCADVVALPFDRRFALAVLPFNSFAELITPAAQARALAEARRVLSESGRFIVTLHNPAVRRRTLDTAPRMLGRFPRPDGGALEVRARDTSLGKGTAASLQTYRSFGPAGGLEREHELRIEFALIEPEQFVRLAQAARFRVGACYGDYDRSAFNPVASPFAIWELWAGAPTTP